MVYVTKFLSRAFNYVQRVLGVILNSVVVFDKKKYKHMKVHFSQTGEDAILLQLMETDGSNPPGFYVDIGCFDPQNISNTYLFYGLGWNGINVDPNPNTIARFQKQRPRDTNVLAACGSHGGHLDYYSFSDGQYNTLDSNRQAEVSQVTTLQNVTKVEVCTLAALLDTFLPKDKTIDFLSVDVEGMDLEVLRSNDWCKFRPSFVVVEDLYSDSVATASLSPMTIFMESVDYELVGKACHNLYFRAHEWRSSYRWS